MQGNGQTVVEVTSTNLDRLVGKQSKIILSLDVRPKGNLFQGKSHEGYLHSSEVNDWFSAAIDKQVFALHSACDREQLLDPKRHILLKEGDKRKTFTTDAALHIVNRASVDEVKRRVLEQYPKTIQDEISISAEPFRPNLVISTNTPFSEDLFAEMRLGSCLLRNVGPTIRCNAIRTNWDKEKYCAEEEPTKTLTKFRNVPGLGVLFGMYYQ